MLNSTVNAAEYYSLYEFKDKIPYYANEDFIEHVFQNISW